VDHPATQAWKRELLTRAELPLPASLTLVPVDFEHPNPDQGLAARLLAAGFDPTQPTFFAWLGVVPYLTLEAFRATVAFLAAQPLGSGLVLDYGLPRASLPPLEQLARDSMASRVQRSGEPFQLFFTPEEIAHELNHPNALNHPAALNQQVAVSHIPSFSHIEDLGSSELNTRYFPDAPANRHPRLRVLGAANRLLTARR
jgi:O-methyltransferase involved in polyketide biosynthesis